MKRTKLEKGWWDPFSKPVNTCNEIFKTYLGVFEAKEREALEIDITFNVQSHYFFDQKSGVQIFHLTKN